MDKEILNEYILNIKPIGKGVYGTVYLAYDQRKKRKVAIKEVCLPLRITKITSSRSLSLRTFYNE